MNTAIDRHSPLWIGPDRIATNRIVIPAMASGTADDNGMATQQTIEHYRRLAAARPGIFIVEYSFVHRSGRSESNQLGASSDAHLPGLAAIAAAASSTGALAGLQLTHAGGKTTREYTDGRLMGPSGIAVPVKDRILEVPAVMSAAEIVLWQDAFVAAAARASAAGFSFIELHAAHGYGLNQWLSPITNQRQDKYGGNLAGRMRILLEIIAGIRLQVPTIQLSVRIPGQDHLDGGLTKTNALEIAKELVKAGVSLINVSSGLGGWRRPVERLGEGYLVPEAAYIQAGLKTPVIAVGGITSGAYIDTGLAAGNFSLAAVGRAILADPDGWYTKNLSLSALQPAQQTKE